MSSANKSFLSHPNWIIQRLPGRAQTNGIKSRQLWGINMNKQHLRALRKHSIGAFVQSDTWGQCASDSTLYPLIFFSIPLMMCGLSERSQITFWTTKLFLLSLLCPCSALQKKRKNNNWASAAANCTKISQSLPVNY